MKRDLGVVLVAAGESRRLPGAVRKPFRALRGRPVAWHSLSLFRSLREVREVVLVAHAEDLARARRMARASRGRARVSVVPGGAVRQQSVARGLSALGPGVRWVAVHDAARPCVSAALVRAVLAAARRAGGAIPALPVGDTLKRVEGGERGGRVRRTVRREGLWGAQTPQILRMDLMKKAFRKGRGRKGWTDDAQAMEAAGFPVAVVPGERWNLKVTTPEDLAIAAKILSIRLKGGC